MIELDSSCYVKIIFIGKLFLVDQGALDESDLLIP